MRIACLAPDVHVGRGSGAAVRCAKVVLRGWEVDDAEVGVAQLSSAAANTRKDHFARGAVVSGGAVRFTGVVIDSSFGGGSVFTPVRPQETLRVRPIGWG